MEYGIILGALHSVVAWLLYPVIFALTLALLSTLWEVGQAIAERYYLLKLFSQWPEHQPNNNIEKQFQLHANKRLERSDLLARSGPILGLMGTLIPLGPGLTALSSGDISILATALTVAFDTTVIGLLVGLIAYSIGRIRRRWYDQTWQTIIEKLNANTTNNTPTNTTIEAIEHAA